MARRTAEITIESEGRDRGKRFLLTEAPAIRAEKWAQRASLAVGKSAVQIDGDLADAGWGALAIIGLKVLGGVNYAAAEPLLDEVLEQVQIIEPKITRPLTPDDVEEVGTLLRLRGEVLALHLGASLVEAISKLRAIAAENAADSTDSMIKGAPQCSPTPPAANASGPGRQRSAA